MSFHHCERRPKNDDIYDDISISWGRIRMKLCEHVGCVTWKNYFNFGEGLNSVPIIFKWFFTIARWVPNTMYSIIYQKKYWARYVLLDQALCGGGMCCTKCLSSFHCYNYLIDAYKVLFVYRNLPWEMNCSFVWYLFTVYHYRSLSDFECCVKLLRI